ncbi:MAG: hypothetical protein AB1488_01695 [Nitrospirota bacterium]
MEKIKKMRGKLFLVGLLIAVFTVAVFSSGAIFAPKNFQDIYNRIGKYIMLVPGKFSGTVAAVDLSTGKTLAWISFWNYGDYTPITHHIAAFPSEDPYKGFEYIINTQGGKNLYIYGIPTKVKDPAAGFHIYRVKYDGTKMNLIEDVAETTGLGLGVHVTISEDAKKFAVGDGQKDIIGVFDRETSKVDAAIFYDWEPNIKNVKEAWSGGGKLIVKKISPDPKTGKYDLQGLKGLKLDWELVPGGENFLVEGKVTGPRAINSVGVDALLFDPRGRWAVTALRVVGASVIHDKTNNYEPVGVMYSYRGKITVGKLNKVDKDTWEIDIPKVENYAHQAGFSPDGKHFLLMGAIMENAIYVWDSSDHSNPMNWKQKTAVTKPEWRGAYPQTFHMGFTPDSKKVYVTLWWPSPTPNGYAVVDAVNWKVIKEVEIGPDQHTLQVTYDGKHMTGVFSAYQKTQSGIFIVDVKTDKLIGFLPNTAGSHDHVIVPRTLKDLRISRSPTT